MERFSSLMGFEIGLFRLKKKKGKEKNNIAIL